MAVGQQVNFVPGIIEDDIEAPQQIIAEQATNLRVGGNIVLVTENIGRHIPELILSNLQHFNHR